MRAIAGVGERRQQRVEVETPVDHRLHLAGLDQVSRSHGWRRGAYDVASASDRASRLWLAWRE
ncbi:MAG TPA: hypothetical protein VM848_07540 [Acidimicrobiia bacterium]|nr:hypothetical protein [Acidimicrobiia bacterium]